MKKIRRGLGLSLCAVLLLAGCSCSNEEDSSVKANISNGDVKLVTGAGEDAKVYDLQAVYDQLKSTAANEVVADKLIEILGDNILFSDANDPTWKTRYDAKVIEKLEAMTKESAYMLNGEFSEELLKTTLNYQLYDITCTDGEDLTDGVESLKCDYTNYVNKALKVDIINELLKEKYVYDEVLKNKTNLFTSKKVRYVEYLAIDSSNEDAQKFIEEAIEKLIAENSTETLKTIAESWEAKLVADLTKKYETLNTSEDASGSTMQDFTNSYTYDPSVGYEIKKKAIEDVNYYEESIVTSDNKGILNTTLIERILSENIVKENVSDKTHKINGKYYVVNPLADSSIDEKDIIIKADGKYYLISVEVLTKESDRSYEAVKVLATNSTLVNEYLNYYLEQSKEIISVHDEEVYEYLKTLYPTIFVD